MAHVCSAGPRPERGRRVEAGMQRSSAALQVPSPEAPASGPQVRRFIPPGWSLGARSSFLFSVFQERVPQAFSLCLTASYKSREESNSSSPRLPVCQQNLPTAFPCQFVDSPSTQLHPAQKFLGHLSARRSKSMTNSKSSQSCLHVFNKRTDADPQTKVE